MDACTQGKRTRRVAPPRYEARARHVRDLLAVWRPLRIRDGAGAEREQARLPCNKVEHPQVRELVVRVDDDRVVLLLDALLLLRRRLGIGHIGDRLAVRRPGDLPQTAPILRESLRLAAEGRDQSCGLSSRAEMKAS